MSEQPEAQAALAVNGGAKVRKTPWPARGLIGAEEKQAVAALFDQAMQSGQAIVYNGPEEEAYCKEFAESLGGGFADAVNSGTTAIYTALHALALPPFSEVIVGAVTDPGGMMPIPLLNLIPMVADSAPGRYNTGPEQIAELITPRTRAIVVAHIAGEPADMPGIMELARKHDLQVVEDCAQAHGAAIAGRPVGTWGDIAAFSTMYGKHHSTGGQGGVVFTRDRELYWRIRQAADRGKPFGLPAGSTNCIASINMNLNELGAVIGRVQLRKLPGIVARRRRVAAGIAEGIAGCTTVSAPPQLDGAEPSYWFLRMAFHSEKATCGKSDFCKALQAEGLPINPSYRAALPHTMDWFVNRNVFGPGGYPWSAAEYEGERDKEFPCPNADLVMDTQFNLSIHEGWGPREITDAVQILRKVDAAYRRG